MKLRRGVDRLALFIIRIAMLAALLLFQVPAPAAAATVAVDDRYSTNEDIALIIAAPGVLANDSSGDGNSLSVVKVAGTAHGLLLLSANGVFTYNPDPNWSGTDSFIYKVNDGAQDSNTATVTITVGPVNDAPVTANDSYPDDMAIPIFIDPPGVLANDVDADGDQLQVMLIKCTPHGNLVLEKNGSFRYDPSPDFTGIDSFTYLASDSLLESNPTTVSIAVGITNRPPVAQDDSYTVDENGELSVTAASGVLANDSDVDHDQLGATILMGPYRGTLAFNPDGSFNYTPLNGWSGTDSFTYQTDAALQYSNVATVTITVKTINATPKAADDSYTTPQDTPLVVAAPGVLGNDTDAENEPLTAAKVSDPANGTLSFNANGSFTYTPAGGYSGTDSFTYTASDGSQVSNLGTVTIKVKAPNRAPAAVDDSYTTDEDTPLVIAAPGVLTNDTDADGDSLVVVKVSDPTNGALALNPDGSFTYTPTGNWFGSDSFMYKANDGILDSNTATVTITVNPVSDAPKANDDSYSTPNNAPLTIAAPGVLSNDTDADGDPLTALLFSSPVNGELTLNSDGSFTYTTAAGFIGTDTFQYKVTDGALESNVATVTVTVKVPNQPPVANADSYSIAEDGVLSVTAAEGVLSNDTDADGNPLTVTSHTEPAHGALIFSPDGSFQYTPQANWNGTDSFTYQVSDGVDTTGPAAVTITVSPVNDAPAAKDDTFTMTARGRLIIAAPGVLANDTDIDGDLLIAVKQSNPAHGTLTLNADGSFTYTPDGGYRGMDSFTYQVNDGSADSSIATVTITGIDEIYLVYLPMIVNGR